MLLLGNLPVQQPFERRMIAAEAQKLANILFDPDTEDGLLPHSVR